MEAPHPCEQSWRDSEGNYVGQRIQLSAEITGGVGHARDSSVQAIEQHGKADRFGREIQVPRFTLAAMHGLENRVEPSRNIRGSEQRGQYIHALAQFSAGTVRFASAGSRIFAIG